MRKFILGAGAALAMAAGHAAAQGLPTQPAAPIVPAGPGGAGGSPFTPASGAAGGSSMATGAPVVGLGDPLPGPSYGGTLTGGGGGGAGGSGMYVEASYLLMFINSTDLPFALATGGPSVGVLGRPGTTVLLGNSSVDYEATSGFKIAAGGWYGGSNLGIEAIGTYLGRTNDRAVLNSGAAVLARPFFDPTTRAENARIISSPGAFNGGITLDNTIQMWGAEFNPFLRVLDGDRVTMDLLVGFRYFGHQEDLVVFDNSRVLAGGVAAFNGFGIGNGTVLQVVDTFGAKTNFYGGNVGAKLSYGRGGPFFIDVGGKIAIGGVNQVLQVDGTTTVQGGPFITPATTGSGFLASGNQLGRRSSNRFAVLPEGDIKLGFQATSWLNVFAGYSFLYLSSAARPADNISRQIALTQLPTAPTYNGRLVGTRVTSIVDNDLWVHGFNFGLTVNY